MQLTSRAMISKFVKKCKKHPVVALLALLFAAATSLATFTEALSSLARYWGWSRLPEVSVTLAGGTASSTSESPTASKQSHYQLRQEGNAISIEPDITYLERLRSGEVLRGPTYQGFFDWKFPTLSFKLANNSTETILLSEVIFKVERSAIDNDPVLVVAPRAKARSLLIRNEGWGPVIDPVLDLGIYPRESCSPAKFRTDSAKRRALPEFRERIAIRIADDIPSGFMKTYKRCAAGLGEDCSLCVYSVLSYKDSDGHARHVRYATQFFQNEFGYGDDAAIGGPLESTFAYDVFLKAGKKGLEVRVPISQEIKQKEAEHFSITVGTNRSARFWLRVLLVDTEGRNFGDKRLSIGIFVPRSANHLREGTAFDDR